MPLPTPLELNLKLLEIVTRHSKVSATWEQHPQPLTFEEFIRIHEDVITYLRGLFHSQLREEISNAAQLERR